MNPIHFFARAKRAAGFAYRDHGDESACADVVKVLAEKVPVMPKLPSIGYLDNFDAAIRQHVKSVFDKFNQNLTVATKALGISVNTLRKYLANTQE